jgi:predicted MFS family arabinose efflux permease
VGKAIRNPPRDAMLAHAGKEMGYGWAFGLHEALDQFGALAGPLIIALIIATSHHDYKTAFAALAVPAAIMLSLLAVARLTYPHPEELSTGAGQIHAEGLPRVFWIYLIAAALVAAGFADFPIMAFHFQRSGSIHAPIIPILYASAMGVSGAGSLVFGRLFDRHGIRILVPLTLISAAYAPLVFLGGFWAEVAGVCLWGLGMGVHESIIPAAVAPMIAPARRASAYGLFTGGYGLAWFAGSAAIGALFGVSFGVVVAFALAAELAAIPLILLVHRLRGDQV